MTYNDELDRAVERLSNVELSDGGCGYGSAVMDVYAQEPENQLYADFRLILSANREMRKALEKSERRAARMEAALEENGNAQAWRDGFKACADVASTVRFHATWGPAASPEDGVRMALESVREAVANSVAAQEARSALTTQRRDGE